MLLGNWKRRLQYVSSLSESERVRESSLLSMHAKGWLGNVISKLLINLSLISVSLIGWYREGMESDVCGSVCGKRTFFG